MQNVTDEFNFVAIKETGAARQKSCNATRRIIYCNAQFLQTAQTVEEIHQLSWRMPVI